MVQEDFGYMIKKEGQKSSSFAKKPLKIVAVLISLISFILLTLSAYYFTKNEDETIEIIKAPNFEIKTRENHSNLSVKNLDKTIYNNIVDNENDDLRNITIVENSQTAKVDESKIKDLDNWQEIIPEAPQVPIQIIDDEVKISKNDKNNPAINEKFSISKEKIIIPSDNKTPNKSNIAVEDSKVAAQANNKISNSKIISAPGVQNDNKITMISKNDKEKSSVKVQLGSLRSEDLAYQTWIKLVNTHPDLLSGLKYYVSKIDLGNKGVFYRLKVGNFKDKSSAQEFCAKFTAKTKKNKADCIIIE